MPPAPTLVECWCTYILARLVGGGYSPRKQASAYKLKTYGAKFFPPSRGVFGDCDDHGRFLTARGKAASRLVVVPGLLYRYVPYSSAGSKTKGRRWKKTNGLSLDHLFFLRRCSFHWKPEFWLVVKASRMEATAQSYN